MPVELPPAYLASAAGDDARDRWLAGLPRLIEQLLEEWQLRPDGPAMSGEVAVVLPVRNAAGQESVLKLGFPHPEAAHEHLALRAWAGNGAVRLLRADPRRCGLVLERAHPGHSLVELPVIEACAVIADLYARLHGPPLPQLDRLSEHAARWARELPRLRESGVVPRRFVDQAVGLAQGFAVDPATDRALIHTDLHYENVLAAEREPWLVIDPKPLAGDPAYEVAPLLWNRWDEVIASGDVRNAVLERMFTVIDLAGLDEDRVRDWIVVRELVNVAWATRKAHVDTGWITVATAIVKAVQR